MSGTTESSNFPPTAGAFQTSWKGNFDAFVTKITPPPKRSEKHGGGANAYGKYVSQSH